MTVTHLIEDDDNLLFSSRSPSVSFSGLPLNLRTTQKRTVITFWSLKFASSRTAGHHKSPNERQPTYSRSTTSTVTESIHSSRTAPEKFSYFRRLSKLPEPHHSPRKTRSRRDRHPLHKRIAPSRDIRRTPKQIGLCNVY